jgi:ribA/ribD-fused uncharacterized protein
MKVTDKHIFFGGEWPSNWYPCHFTVNHDGKELEFFNSEQYFMWMKAITFGDEEIALRILLEGKNPKTAKSLGRKVRNYDDRVWDEKRFEEILNANMYKYAQNPELNHTILDHQFDGKKFVEASPIDGIWGIKCGEEEALDDESNWNGLNLLGKVLDEVRRRLLSEL